MTPDTRATPGWLPALADTFRKISGTGLVGAKLILADGRLQEAGATVWRDASRQSYGTLDDSSHPKYNFAPKSTSAPGRA